MEAEQKTPVIITAEERLQLFLIYHGHHFDDGQPGKLNYGQIIAHNIHFEGSLEDGYSYFIADYPIETCSICVKPLAGISQVELDGILSLHGMRTERNDFSCKVINWNDTGRSKFGFEWDDGYEWGRLPIEKLNYKAVDELRRLGFAMGYGKYSIAELVDAGVYKVINI